VLKSELDF